MSRKANWQFNDPDAYKREQESLTPLVHIINGLLEAPLPEIEQMHLIGQLLSYLDNTKKRRAGRGISAPCLPHKVSSPTEAVGEGNPISDRQDKQKPPPSRETE